MKLATSSYTWGKLRDEKETGRMLDEVLGAGLTHLALQPPDLLPPHMLDDPGIFKDQAVARGVEIVALGGFANDLSAQLVRTYGAEVMWAVVNSASMADWVRSSLELADDVAGMDVALTIHPHLKSPLESSEQISEFFSTLGKSRQPEIGLCLDPGHLTGARVDPVKTVEDFRDRIGLVHITDYMHPDKGRSINFEENFVDLGEGIVNYPPILRKLNEVGYDGWYVLEAHYPKNRTPLETVRINRERFEELVARS